VTPEAGGGDGFAPWDWIGVRQPRLEGRNGEGRAVAGPPLGENCVFPGACYQTPGDLQPPSPVVGVQARVETPVLASFVIENVFVDFDVAVTV
jgi:hypothetical protein